MARMRILIIIIALLGTCKGSTEIVSPTQEWLVQTGAIKSGIPIPAEGSHILDASILTHYTNFIDRLVDELTGSLHMRLQSMIDQGLFNFTTPPRHVPNKPTIRPPLMRRLFQQYAGMFTRYFGWQHTQTAPVQLPMLTRSSILRKLFTKDIEHLKFLENNFDQHIMRRHIAFVRMYIAQFYKHISDLEEEPPTKPDTQFCAQMIANQQLCSPRSFNEISQWYLCSGSLTPAVYDLLHEYPLRKAAQCLPPELRQIVLQYANNPELFHCHSIDRHTVEGCDVSEGLVKPHKAVNGLYESRIGPSFDQQVFGKKDQIAAIAFTPNQTAIILYKAPLVRMIGGIYGNPSGKILCRVVDQLHHNASAATPLDASSILTSAIVSDFTDTPQACPNKATTAAAASGK
jgi:hypothetical protein